MRGLIFRARAHPHKPLPSLYHTRLYVTATHTGRIPPPSTLCRPRAVPSPTTMTMGYCCASFFRRGTWEGKAHYRYSLIPYVRSFFGSYSVIYSPCHIFASHDQCVVLVSRPPFARPRAHMFRGAHGSWAGPLLPMLHTYFPFALPRESYSTLLNFDYTVCTLPSRLNSILLYKLRFY